MARDLVQLDDALELLTAIEAQIKQLQALTGDHIELVREIDTVISEIRDSISSVRS